MRVGSNPALSAKDNPRKSSAVRIADLLPLPAI
jgi:hypothetical protein